MSILIVWFLLFSYAPFYVPLPRDYKDEKFFFDLFDVHLWICCVVDAMIKHKKRININTNM